MDVGRTEDPLQAPTPPSHRHVSFSVENEAHHVSSEVDPGNFAGAIPDSPDHSETSPFTRSTIPSCPSSQSNSICSMGDLESAAFSRRDHFDPNTGKNTESGFAAGRIKQTPRGSGTRISLLRPSQFLGLQPPGHIVIGIVILLRVRRHSMASHLKIQPS